MGKPVVDVVGSWDRDTHGRAGGIHSTPSKYFGDPTITSSKTPDEGESHQYHMIHTDAQGNRVSRMVPSHYFAPGPTGVGIGNGVSIPNDRILSIQKQRVRDSSDSRHFVQPSGAVPNTARHPNRVVGSRG